MFPHASKLARGAALVGFALSFAPAPASAQTPVVFGDTISDPGIYFLFGNQSGIGTGIQIESDDVLLLLGRFTLRGSGIKGGIVSEGHTNVNIVGGRVTNFGVGIFIDNGDDVTVKDLRVDHCAEAGVRVIDTVDSSFLRMRSDHNGADGVDGQDVDNCRFLSVLAHDNRGNGIHIQEHLPMVAAALGDGPDSTNNKIKLCWAAYNGLDGIRLADADDNEVERNQCVGNDHAGIRLGTMPPEPSVVNAPGSQRNYLRSNWCVFNEDGIRAEPASGDNTLTNNTALANFHHDMVDENAAPPCANTWFLNFFLTKGGASAGCIF